MHNAFLLLCLLVGLLSADSILASQHAHHPAKPRTGGHHFRKRDHPRHEINNPLIASRQVKAEDIRTGKKYSRDCPGPVISGSCNCPTGETTCAGNCVDLTSDASNCGYCGHTCNSEFATGSVCVDSNCQCPYSEQECYYGLCVDITSDPANCGSCGNSCSAIAGSFCLGGSCECPAPESNCGGTCTSTVNNPNACGTCGIDCATLIGIGAVCIGTTCECPAPTSTTCFGLCTDVLSDDANCGVCGYSCGETGSCVDGACMCDSGYTQCSASPFECADLEDDSNNCGACGNVCQDGSFCQGGACVCTNAPYTTYCVNECVDLLTDPYSCGFCENYCEAQCVNGQCTQI